jgi:DNA-binding MarR family transcriptional regulator
MLDRFQGTIYDALREKDGMSQREIARVLDVSFTSVNRHINRMASMGVVLLVRKGMSVRCYIVNGHEPGKAGEAELDPPGRE